MKKTIYALLVCYFISAFAFAQGKKHIATIIENKSGSIIKGLLYAVSDTDVVLTFRNISESQMKNAQVHYKFDKIDLLKIRRKNNPAIYSAIGGILGGSILYVVGHNSYKKPTKEGEIDTFGSATNQGLFFGGIGLVAGFSVGITIGSKNKKININKSQANLANNKTLIKKYCIVNE